MSRIHLHKKRFSFKIKPVDFIIILSISIFTSLYFVFTFLSNAVTPSLMNNAEIEVRKLSNYAINQAINDNLKKTSIEDMFIISKDSNDRIITLDFNSLYVSTMLSSITKQVQRYLRYIEKGQIDKIGMDADILGITPDKLKKGVIYEITSGAVFNNPILANLGPKIPVKITLLGDIISNVNTKVTNYGINNALIEVSISIQVKEQIILPFSSDVIVVEQNSLIATKIIQGNVPSYYFNGIDKSSPSITLPVE